MSLEGVRIDDLQLLVGEPGSRAGAVFYLAEQPGRDAVWGRGDGLAVWISAASRCLVATGGTEDVYPAAWHEAYEAAQEALDVWSFRGVADLATEDPFGNHVAFWDDARGPVVRVAARSRLSFGGGVATVVVRDGAGNVKPHSAPPDAWHQSMRFFRLSQLTGDLLDAMRNLWLALENLLDDIEPQGDDNEEKWLRRALKAAGEKVNLSGYVPAQDTSRGTPPAAHNAAYAYFYDDLRTHLFHAKASRHPVLPKDVSEVRDLAQRHSLLTNLYLDLLSAVTGVRRGTGVVTYAGFQVATDHLHNDARVLVTDDPTPVHPDDDQAAPGGGTVLGVAASHAPELEAPGVRVFVGAIPGSELGRLADARVGRILLESAGACVTAHNPEGELYVPGIAALEAQLEIGLHNARLPKQFAGY